MRVAVVSVERGFELQLDGRVRLQLDDLYLVAWGECHRLARDGLLAGETDSEVSHDEIGVHERVAFRFVTRSVRNPIEFRLVARCYEAVPVLALELIPSLSQPVFGSEEAAGCRFAAAPGAVESIYLHQRVSEYGRDAVGQWWAQTHFGADPTRDHPFDWGLFSLWRCDDGTCCAVAPMRAGGAVARLRGDERGLSVVASGGCGRHLYPRLPLAVIATGDQPAEAIDRVIESVSKLCEWSFRLRRDKVHPELFESLGYATWGALGREVTLESVDEALRSLRDAGIPARWLCLDEGWQELNQAHQLTGFDADRERFPPGLAASVRQLQAAGGLRHLGVWLTLQGAWGGVAPESPLGTRQVGRLVTAADGSRIPGPRPGDQPFWDDWFSHLSTSGLDFVKVDGQGSLRTLFFGQQALDDAASGLLGNLETAADGCGMHLVASMSHHAECLYHYTSTNVIRVSADIAPSDLRAAKLHLVHSVWAAAWLSRIGLPDFDAFATTHPAARAFAVAAAMLAGPVYLCDAPGRHDAGLARRLCLADGRLLVPHEPAMPPATRFCANPLDDNRPLVLVTRAAMLPRQRAYDTIGAGRVTPVTFVAVINCGLSGEPLADRIELNELGLSQAGRYAVVEHFAGRRQVVPAGGGFEFQLGELGAEVFAVAPLYGTPVALGLVDKLLGACGCAVDEDGLVSLPEPGTALVYDEDGRRAEAIDYLPYTLVDDGRKLNPGEARRDGAWLEVAAKSTIFRLTRSG